MRTQGVSPKVYIPLLVNIIGAVVLYAMGETELSTGALLSLISVAGVGYGARPGAIELDEEVFDSLLSEYAEFYASNASVSDED